MRLCRYCWVACLVFLLVFRGEAFAAVVPAYSGKMNTAVGGVISHKIGKWGFAANDPRFGATMNGVGAGLTTVALGVAGGAVATIGWPALLAAAGVSALVTGAVSLGQDAIYKWLFNPDQTVTISGGTSLPSGVGASLVNGQPYFGCVLSGDTWLGGSKEDACMGAAAAYNTGAYGDYGQNVLTSCNTDGYCYVTRTIAWSGISYPNTKMGQWVSKGNWTGATCTGWIKQGTSECHGQVGTPAPTTTKPVSDAVADIPASELTKPVSDQALAAAVNAAWKAMGNVPNTLPWSATDPVTPADIATWKAANPDLVPTVGDFIAPVTSPSSTVVPIHQPGSQTSTGPSPTTGQGTQVDLGLDPNTPPPGLEATPTAQMIMDPILNLMPDLRNFSVPAHSSECPKGTFDALGRTYTIDSQCSLIEQNRSIIEAAMLLVWAIVSIFIVLRA